MGAVRLQLGVRERYSEASSAGLDYVGLNGVGYAPNPVYAGTIPQLVYMIFQAMFAIVTPALIIGAFAERVKLKALVVFTFGLGHLRLRSHGHWVWGAGGWAHQLGHPRFRGRNGGPRQRRILGPRGASS